MNKPLNIAWLFNYSHIPIRNVFRWPTYTESIIEVTVQQNIICNYNELLTKLEIKKNILMDLWTKLRIQTIYEYILTQRADHTSPLIWQEDLWPLTEGNWKWNQQGGPHKRLYSLGIYIQTRISLLSGQRRRRDRSSKSLASKRFERENLLAFVAGS